MDSDSHIMAPSWRPLSELFQNDNDIDAIIAAEAEQEIIEILKRY